MWGSRRMKRWPTYSHVVVNVVTVTHTFFLLFFLRLLNSLFLYFLSLSLSLSVFLSLFLSSLFHLPVCLSVCPRWIRCQVHHPNHGGEFRFHLPAIVHQTIQQAVSSSLKICSLKICPLNKFCMCGFLCGILMSDKRAPAPPSLKDEWADNSRL